MDGGREVERDAGREGRREGDLMRNQVLVELHLDALVRGLVMFLFKLLLM